MIQTCFFDIGGVLIDFDAELMLENLCVVTRIDSARFLQIAKDHAFVELSESGKLTFIDIHKILLEHGSKASFEQLQQALCSAFKQREKMSELILQLKQKNVQLITLSNTNDVHSRHLFQTYPLFSHFDAHVLSFEVGAMKPSEQIYQYALSKAENHKSLYIDDRKDLCDAGKKHGLKVHHYQGFNGLLDHLTTLGILP